MKYKIMLKIALILLVVVLSFVFIKNNEIELDRIEENNITYVIISQDALFSPDSIVDLINRIIGVPFDLNYYKFCFEDKGTHKETIYGNSTDNLIWNVTVRFQDNNETLTLKPYSKKCAYQSIAYEKITFDSVLSYSFTIDKTMIHPNSLKIVPDTRVFAIPNQRTLWAKRFIFIVALFSLFLMFQSIFNFIKGEKEK